MVDIIEILEEYKDYLKDESRLEGRAESISFPKTEDEIKQILIEMNKKKIHVTVQGALTGITGGAVPMSGHVMNLSKMADIKGFYFDQNRDVYILILEPGVSLEYLNDYIKGQKKLKSWFFPPDPTEKTASIGGIAANDASGARSFKYGSARFYIEALTIVLADGRVVDLKRGDKALNHSFEIITRCGQSIVGSVPSYKMPGIKNVAGFYNSDNMDIVDLFVGSEGTLGVISKLEISLARRPDMIWGINIFLPDEKSALKFTNKIRHGNSQPVAIEYFDNHAISLLRRAVNEGYEIPNIPKGDICVIYLEFHEFGEVEWMGKADTVTRIIRECGGNEDNCWIAVNELDLQKLKYFRHAIPEYVNTLIGKIQIENPTITKLGTDMAVPDNMLENAFEMYREDLRKANIDSVVFGHIGNNHVHVNLIPQNVMQYEKGIKLYKKWTEKIIKMGGTFTGEHGTGKIKLEYLKQMVGEKGIEEMVSIKKLIDPNLILGRGNLFTC